MGKIGLDFGTSTTVVAIDFDAKGPKSIPLVGQSDVLFPSVMTFDGDSFQIGNKSDTHAIRSIKKAIYENRKTLRQTVGSEVQIVDVDDAILSFLTKIREILESKGLNPSAPDAVRMGCPALWGHEQRLRLANLASRAGLGLENNTLIDEAIAAGLTWIEGNKKLLTPEDLILVFDLGGGTLDVAVLEVSKGETALDKMAIRVLASEGSNHAGDDVDRALVTALGFKPSDSQEILNAENAKMALGRRPKKDYVWPGSGKELKVDVLRNSILSSMESYWKPTIDLALRRAKLNSTKEKIWTGSHAALVKLTSLESLASEISSVVLVGGMANILDLQDALRGLFPSAAIFLGDRQLEKDSKEQTPDQIAVGLANETEINSLNVHRPFYNIFLEWGANSLPLYPAYEPPYSADQIRLEAAHLHRTWRLDRDMELPTKGQGRIVLKKNSGQRVPITLSEVEYELVPRDGAFVHTGAVDRREVGRRKYNLEEIPFNFGNFNTPSVNSGYEPRVVFYPSGWFAIFHGDGNTTVFTVNQWNLDLAKIDTVDVDWYKEAILHSYKGKPTIQDSLYGGER